MDESTSNSPSSPASDVTEQLIELYRQHVCLWQVTDFNYKNRYVRDDALLAIAHELKLTTKEVKEKVTRLRTLYHHYRRQGTKQKTGSGAEESKVIKWKWFNSLKFLSDTVKPRATLSNLNEV